LSPAPQVLVGAVYLPFLWKRISGRLQRHPSTTRSGDLIASVIDDASSSHLIPGSSAFRPRRNVFPMRIFFELQIVSVVWWTEGSPCEYCDPTFQPRFIWS
jgi:hypothetical protein